MKLESGWSGLGLVVFASRVLAGGPDVTQLPPDLSQSVSNAAIQSAIQVASDSGARQTDILQELLYAIIAHVGVLPSLIILLLAAAVPIIGGILYGIKRMTPSKDKD